MGSRRLSASRILLIWCGWPILLLGALAAVVMNGGGSASIGCARLLHL